jgi:hypothetical protein
MTQRKELPVLLAVVFAIAMTWPPALHLGSEAQLVDDRGATSPRGGTASARPDGSTT